MGQNHKQTHRTKYIEETGATRTAERDFRSRRQTRDASGNVVRRRARLYRGNGKHARNNIGKTSQDEGKSEIFERKERT